MTVDDIKAKVDALVADVQALQSVDQKAIALLNGLVATIADLKAQLAAAGTDPVKLQAVADSLDAVHTGVSTEVQALGAAVTADTPPAG